MPNSLLQLEKSLAGGAAPAKKRRRKASTKADRKATGERRPAAAPLVQAAQAVDYRVPGIVQPLAQPSGQTCWATVATIMERWRQQRSMTIPSAIAKAGQTYVDKFNANQWLLGSEKVPFLTGMGLSAQLPQSLAPWGWESLLRRYGPLWVTTDEDPSAGFAIHARVMTGIHGDGTATGTTIDIVDPGGGRSYSERFDVFTRKFEQEALAGQPLRVQIVHWPQDTGLQVNLLVRGKSAAYALSLQAGQHSTVDEDEFEPEYDEAHPSVSIGRAQSAFSHGLAKPKAMTAADVRWAADADSPDYRHLGAAIDTTPFDISARTFKRLIAWNRFSVLEDTKVVFALRGCTLDASVTTWVPAITVREVEPNHTDNRCVIGVWDRSADTLVAFQGSTVPNWEYMERYRQNHAKRANMQGSGRYTLVVGTHRARSRNRVLGALCNRDEMVVLRTQDDLTYTTRDAWDRTRPANNVHPGMVAVNSGASTKPDFSSAGCQTIPGKSANDVPSGEWAEFRTALGLDNRAPSSNDGRRFPYLLFTGREARLTVGSGAALERLRFGSQGEEVRRLQEALARHPHRFYTGKVDGALGPITVLSFINFQKERDKGAADGIVTPSDASALGFTLATTSAQQLGVTDVITDVARGIFNAWRKRPEEGKFAVTSDIAEFMHDDTAASRQWTRTTVEFKLKGSAPSSDIKDLARLDPAAAHVKVFKFLLDFEHNGYDIKNAQVTRVIQGSSPMKRGQFTCEFKAKNATSTTAEMARIEFLLTGKWDPGLGTKFYDFKGKLHLEADGDFGFTLDKNERVSIDFVAGATFANMKRVPGTAPKNQVQRTVVFFAKPGSDVVSEKEMTRVKRWIRELQQTAKVRYDRLRAGKLPIYVEGHASPTGKGQMNQDLSRRRMEKVAKLVRDELGSEAKVITSARGEADPAYKDTRSDENDFDRRVDIWIEVSGVG